MRTKMLPVSATAALALAAGTALANSGTQLPLSQYQAGTEQTSSAIVVNGGFEQPGSPNPNPNPTGWTLEGTMQVGTPINPPTPAAPLGNFAAQGPLGATMDFNKYVQPLTLTPGTDYVLSAYIWNLGQPSVGSEFGDLAVVEVVDAKNLFNTKTLALERVALDGGDGANGYFVYDTFNSNQFPDGAFLEVEADISENIPGQRPHIWAQFDNVAITPLNQFVPPQPIATGSTWNVNSGGLWSQAGNWQGGVPDGVGAMVTFGPAITSPVTVTLDSNRTVGTVIFNNANKYTIAGTSTLTFDVPSGSATIRVVDFGSHEIATPVQLNDNTNVAVTLSGSTLRLSGQVSAAPGVTLTKQGAGVLEMRNVRIPGLHVADGRVRVLPDGTSAATSNVQSLTIDSAAWLDVTDNAVVVDYTGTSPLNQIRDHIVQSYNNGAWDAPGITSSMANNSTHGVGYAEASSLSGNVPAIFGTVDDTAVLLRHTRYGDANLDGVVNLADFNRLAANFGATGAQWVQGDFNYDGFVNLADFNRLAANFGLQAGPDGPTPDDWSNLASAVPEPATIGLLMLAVPLIQRRRRG